MCIFEVTFIKFGNSILYNLWLATLHSWLIISDHISSDDPSNKLINPKREDKNRQAVASEILTIMEGLESKQLGKLKTFFVKVLIYNPIKQTNLNPMDLSS